MFITRLEIEGFGHFNKNLILEFKPEQLGLVFGKNETGKSTIVAAIFAVLYGLKPAEKRRWKSWEFIGDYQIKLFFIQNNRHYLLERNFENDLVRLIEMDGEEKIHYNDYHSPSDKFDQVYFNAIQQIFSLPSKEVLQATSIIYQHQLEINPNASLRRIITGANETDYEDVLTALEEEYYSITREKLPWQKYGGKRSDQLLEKKQKLLADYENNLDTLTQYFKEQQEIQKNLLAAEAEKKKLEQKISLLQRLLIQVKKFEKIQSQINQLQEKKKNLLNQLHQVEAILSEKQSIDKQLEYGYSLFLSFDPVEIEKEINTYFLLKKRRDEIESRLAELQNQISILESEKKNLPDFTKVPENFLFILDEIQRRDEEIPRFQEQESSLVAQLTKINKKLRSRILLALFFFVIGAISGALTWKFNPLQIWSWAITALILFSGIIVTLAEVFPVWKKAKKQKEDLKDIQIILKRAKSSREENLQTIKNFIDNDFFKVKSQYRQYRRIESRLKELELLIKSAESDLESVVANPDFQNFSQKYQKLLDTYREKLVDEVTKYRKLRDKQLALSQQLFALPDIENLVKEKENLVQQIANFEFEKKEVFSRVPVIRDLLSKFSIEALIEKMEKENVVYTSRQNELDRIITSYRIQLQQNTKMNYNPEQLLNERNILLEEIHRLEQRKNALILALETLRDSIQEFRNSHLEAINNGIQKYLKQVIHPFHYGVQIDNDFHVNMYYKGIPISLDQLSSGCHDQLFFAYRLVLSEMLAPNVHFPILIDDAFVHFDPERRKNIFKILKKLKKKYQIILFSSNPSYRRSCDYVIELNNVE